MLLDALKELSLLLRHLLLPLTIQEVKDLVSNTRAAQPPKARERECHKSQRHKRVERDLRDDRFRQTRREKNGARSAGEESIGDGEQELVSSARNSQLEEAVPVERGEFGGLRLIGIGAGEGLCDDGGEALRSERRC